MILKYLFAGTTTIRSTLKQNSQTKTKKQTWKGKENGIQICQKEKLSESEENMPVLGHSGGWGGEKILSLRDLDSKRGQRHIHTGKNTEGFTLNTRNIQRCNSWGFPELKNKHKGLKSGSRNKKKAGYKGMLRLGHLFQNKVWRTRKNSIKTLLHSLSAMALGTCCLLTPAAFLPK